MSACNTIPEAEPDGLDLSGTDCISVRTIRDYTVLDDRNLLIHGSAKRSYFVTLLNPSMEMRSSIGMGFSTRDGWLCRYGGNSIVFDGMSREEVRIRSISRLTADQVEQILVRFGQGDARTAKTPAPRPVDGAGVEEQD